MPSDQQTVNKPGQTPSGSGKFIKTAAGIAILFVLAPAIESPPGLHEPLSDFLSALYGLTLFLLTILLGSTLFTLLKQAITRK